jgi:glycosyltransferase involved in cell wall biosynthesis
MRQMDRSGRKQGQFEASRYRAMAHIAKHSAEVSIIITAYNDARFLAEAIRSAKSQGQPVEVIVVDDGSRDNPQSIVSQFDNIKFVRQRNQGLSSARNTGLNVATGEFIVFLDADDRLLPGAVASNLSCFDNNREAGMVYGGHTVIDQVGRTIKVVPVERMANPCSELLLGNLIGMHGAAMYKRQAIDVIGGFDTSLRACEDWDVFLRISRGFCIGCNEDSIAEYRKHGANMSNYRSLILREALKVLKKHAQIYKISPHELIMAEHSWRQFYSLSLTKELRSFNNNGDERGRLPPFALLMESFRIFRLAPAHSARALLRPATGSFLDRSLVGWELSKLRRRGSR